MDDLINNIKANRLQRLANEQDQGQFSEGIGEEIDEAAPTEPNITTRQRSNVDDILIA